MSNKPTPPPQGSVTNITGNVIGANVGQGNTLTTGDITVYEASLKDSANAIPPDLSAALVAALKGIQESPLSDTLKAEAAADHGKLTDQLKRPAAEREPTLIKKFWNGLWTVAEKVPAVVGLYDVLKNHVPGL
jgi:hypothetical protein